MQISIVILKTPFCVIFILQRKLFSFIIIMLCIICIYQKLVKYNNIFIDIHIYVYVYGTYQHIITTIKNYNNTIFMNKRKQTKIIINKKETLKKTTREWILKSQKQNTRIRVHWTFFGNFLCFVVVLTLVLWMNTNSNNNTKQKQHLVPSSSRRHDGWRNNVAEKTRQKLGKRTLLP